jgi:type IV secretory pathway VirB10-like protein
METRQPPPRGVRLRRSTLLIAGGVVVLLVVGGVYVLATVSISLPALTPPDNRPDTTPHEVVQVPEVISQRRRDYGEPTPPGARPATTPPVSTTPPPPAAMTTQQGLLPPFPGVPPAPGALPPPDTGVPETQPSSTAQPARQPVRQARAAGSGVPPKRSRPSTWLFAKGEVVGSPYGEDTEAAPPGSGPPEARQGRQQAGTLIPAAHWEKPRDPTKVLYPSQMLNVTLLTDIVSDIPSEIRLLVTEPVEDKFFQGRTLVPQYAVLIANQAGQAQFGQERVDIAVRTAEFPDGTMVQFDKGAVGDQTGAGGLSGSVDRHYLQLGIGAVLTTFLSVGSRYAGGSTGTFRPSIQEDIAADISQSVNRTGQQIIQKEFHRPPTITVPRGTAATIQLKEPYSFQTGPRTIRR